MSEGKQTIQADSCVADAWCIRPLQCEIAKSNRRINRSRMNGTDGATLLENRRGTPTDFLKLPNRHHYLIGIWFFLPFWSWFFALCEQHQTLNSRPLCVLHGWLRHCNFFGRLKSQSILIFDSCASFTYSIRLCIFCCSTRHFVYEIIHDYFWNYCYTKHRSRSAPQCQMKKKNKKIKQKRNNRKLYWKRVKKLWQMKHEGGRRAKCRECLRLIK